MFCIRHSPIIHETLHVCCSKHCSLWKRTSNVVEQSFFTRASNFVMGTYECENVIKRRDAQLAGKSNVELDESEHGGQLGRPQLARSVRMDGGHRPFCVAQRFDQRVPFGDQIRYPAAIQCFVVDPPVPFDGKREAERVSRT